LTSCLTGLDKYVLQIKTIVSCNTSDSKLVKQEVNGTVILPPLVFLGLTLLQPIHIPELNRDFCKCLMELT
jgi:hypothetical protein